MEKRQKIATILALFVTIVQLVFAIIVFNFHDPTFVYYYYLFNDTMLIVIGLIVYISTSKKLK